MASLAHYIKKFGKRAGRKEYNAFHRAYRRANHEKFLRYWRENHAKNAKHLSTASTSPVK